MPPEYVAAVGFLALTRALAAARPGVILKERQTLLTVSVGQQELTEPSQAQSSSEKDHQLQVFKWKASSSGTYWLWTLWKLFRLFLSFRVFIYKIKIITVPSLLIKKKNSS